MYFSIFCPKKLSKGFIKENLSHQFYVNVKIFSGGLDAVMAHHFFDFIDG
jgi:hypothetical protein